jgi:SAM-dependent methyltransferase
MNEKRPPFLDLDKDFKEILSFIERYEIQVDSLWIIPRRDNSGSLRKFHHGEFIAQIPRQAILRFTKPYDLILDPFVGYGTTLVECVRLGRHGIGVEIEPEIASSAKMRIASEFNLYDVRVEVIEGDSRKLDFQNILNERGFKEANLVISHPPYHDIIKYGKNPANLCNIPTIEGFLKAYGEVLDNILKVLSRGGYYVLVIGDKYTKGEWIPLGFYVMNETLRRGLRLKAICVKNFEETMGKRGQIHLWKFRTLKWGTYFFKHEYVMFFQKNV